LFSFISRLNKLFRRERESQRSFSALGSDPRYLLAVLQGCKDGIAPSYVGTIQRRVLSAN